MLRTGNDFFMDVEETRMEILKKIDETSTEM